MIALSCSIKISAVRHLGLSQCTRVTDRRTDARADRITTPKTALAYAGAVKIKCYCNLIVIDRNVIDPSLLHIAYNSAKFDESSFSHSRDISEREKSSKLVTSFT